MNDEETAFVRSFGQRCKQYRKERGWTLEDMIPYGLSAQHYQKIEVGKKNLRLWTAQRIATAFGVSLSELLEGL